MNKYFKIGLFLLTCVLLYFPIFLKLDTLSISPWDESLFAVRAYYLNEFGETIKSFHQLENMGGITNTKPAFFTYIQAGFYRIFGYTELALRLPTAMTFLFTCFFMIYISKKLFNNIIIGMISALILVTSQGMLVTHMGRFGDQDVPFAFFLFIALYNIFQFLQEKKNLHLIVSFIFFTIAFFVKSVSAFLIFPGILLYLLASKQLLVFLRNKKVLFLIILVGSLVLYSYAGDGNHLQNISRLIDSHKHNEVFLHYYEILFHESYFMPWLLFIPLIFWFHKKNKFILFIGLQIICIFLILSFAKTKLYWYLAPIFPLLSIIAAMVIYQILELIYNNISLPKKQRNFFIGVVVFLLFAAPYQNAISTVYNPQNSNQENHIGGMMRVIKKDFPDLKSFHLLKDYNAGFLPQLNFYLMLYKKHYNFNIGRRLNYRDCQVGDYLICDKEWQIDGLKKSYELEFLSEYYSCKLIHLKNLKDKL